MKRLLTLLLMLSLCCSFAMADVKTNEFAITNVGSLNVRKSPGGDFLLRLDKGDPVLVLETVEKKGKTYAHVSLMEDKWTRQGQKLGWIDTYYLTGLHEAYTDVVKVAAGYNHVSMLTADGTVHTMGGTFLHPESLDGLTNVKDIAAACFTNAALLEDGTVQLSKDVFFREPERWTSIECLFGNPFGKDYLAGVDTSGMLHSNGRWGNDELVVHPDVWQNLKRYFFCSNYAIGLSQNGTLHILPNEAEPFCPAAILAADGMTGVADAACGVDWMLLLMESGEIRLYADNNDATDRIKAATDWTDVTQLYGSVYYVIGITSDGRVRMAGRMPRVDLSASINSEDWVNFEESGELTGYTDIVSASCSQMLIALLHADGHVDMLSAWYSLK